MKRLTCNQPAKLMQRSDRPRILASRQRPEPKLIKAMISVTRYRFRKFREAFGRNPTPTEPLYFVKDLPYPVLVGDLQLMEQVSEAAEAMGIDPQQLKAWLRLL